MIGKVQAIAKGGAGVIHEPDKTVFVPGVIAGETVEYAAAEPAQIGLAGKIAARARSIAAAGRAALPALS